MPVEITHIKTNLTCPIERIVITRGKPSCKGTFQRTVALAMNNLANTHRVATFTLETWCDPDKLSTKAFLNDKLGTTAGGPNPIDPLIGRERLCMRPKLINQLPKAF